MHGTQTSVGPWGILSVYGPWLAAGKTTRHGTLFLSALPPPGDLRVVCTRPKRGLAADPPSLPVHNEHQFA